MKKYNVENFVIDFNSFQIYYEYVIYINKKEQF
jgi:hypothetical protein